MQDTLTEISEWLESHPREVVILACRNFEGMTEDLHEYLVACIKNIFGDMLCPRGVRSPVVGLEGQDHDRRLPCSLGPAERDAEAGWGGGGARVSAESPKDGDPALRARGSPVVARALVGQCRLLLRHLGDL